MLEAMMSANVGDDVFGEDPSINALEDKCAKLFGAEAAIFCPSGTMTNQIGIKVLTNPYQEVICYSGAHIYKYEGGGVAGNSGLSFRLLSGKRGILNIDDIVDNINPDDIHFPKTKVVALENTVNKGGGAYYTLAQIKEISKTSRAHGLKVHLDGARLFNALVETGDSPQKYGKYFDTISVCLSKGLGAPVGSVLVGRKKYIKQALRVRKYFGGGMRQAGFLAAAGIYALDNHIERLTEDHEKAKILGETVEKLPMVASVQSVKTNIVIFKLAGDLLAEEFLTSLDQEGIKAVPFGKQEVRFVTHLDFTDNMLDHTVSKLKKF